MSYSRDAVDDVGLLGSQPNLQCKDFGPSTYIDAARFLVRRGLLSRDELGDDHHFSGSVNRIDWGKIEKDGKLTKVLRTTLPEFI